MRMDPFKIERFKLVRLLGRGRFGQVFQYSLASSTNVTNEEVQNVAVKKLRISAEEFQGNRDCREITLSLALQCHRNIVRFFGFCEIDLQMALVMEVCKGDLQRLIDSPKILAEDEVAFLVRQMCQGLAFLHGKSIIHRDIKPHNILLQCAHNVDIDTSAGIRELVLKIADFALAKMLDEDATSATMTVVGTRLYMAPELRDASNRKMHYGMKADVYSLGLVAYNLLRKDLSKLVPTSEGYGALIINKQAFGGSSNFNSFLSACLQQQPERRQTSAQLMQHPFIRTHELSTMLTAEEHKEEVIRPLLDLQEKVFHEIIICHIAGPSCLKRLSIKKKFCISDGSPGIYMFVVSTEDKETEVKKSLRKILMGKGRGDKSKELVPPIMPVYVGNSGDLARKFRSHDAYWEFLIQKEKRRWDERYHLYLILTPMEKTMARALELMLLDKFDFAINANAGTPRMPEAIEDFFRNEEMSATRATASQPSP